MTSNAVQSFHAGFEIRDNADTGLSGPNQRYFNVNAFVTTCGATPTPGCQPLGTFGSLGWNSLTGPSFWDMDLALSRIFRIRERHSLEIRADAFNLTNSFVSNPASSAHPGSSIPPGFEAINNSLFGINNVAQPTRKIQFALKYAF